MPSELYISKAGSFAWAYETGVGSVMSGVNNLDANFLTADIGDYYNCDLIECGQYGAQLFNCDDVVNQQFSYSRTDYDPMVVIYDADGNHVKTIEASAMVSDSGTYLFSVDFAEQVSGQDLFTCGECYTMKLWSKDVVAPIANLFTDGSNGTMESPPGILNMGSGANNATIQSNSQAQAGTDSMRITAGGVPVNNDRLIAYGTTPLVLLSGNMYEASAWVYLDAGTPFINGQDIYIDIAGTEGLPLASYWTDANIISEIRYNFGTSGTGVWVNIKTTFQVNSDTTGTIAITSLKIPSANGVIYVDTITLRLVTNFLEATTEKISLAENHKCTLRVDYGAIPGSEHEQFGILYDGANFNFFNTLRLRFRAYRFSMTDPNYETTANSENSARVVVSRLTKEYLIKITDCPGWLMEKLPMAMKHDDVRFYFGNTYVNMICLTKDFKPNYADEKNACYGSLEFVMRVKDYDYANNACN